MVRGCMSLDRHHPRVRQYLQLDLHGMVAGTFYNSTTAFMRARTYRNPEPDQWIVNYVVAMARGGFYGCVDVLGVADIQISGRYRYLALSDEIYRSGA
jgi:hypothetical protein